MTTTNTPQNTITGKMPGPSIADRIAAIRRSLSIAITGARAAETGVKHGVIVGNVEPDELAAAIARVTEEALRELYWIEHALPADMLNAPAPTDDERDETEAEGGR